MVTRPAVVLLWVCLAAAHDGAAAVRYVNLNNPAPVPSYTTWASAATNIQDAIDVAAAGDEIVVTNGVYQIGGRAVYGAMTNRVAVTQALTVRSVNGPEVTVIRGYQVPGTTNGDGAVRCVYLTNGAALVGFTLTNGATVQGVLDLSGGSGGGVWCESSSAVVSNCVLSGNSAFYWGGGAYFGALNNCTLNGNSAGYYGGGASYGTLNNCALNGNLSYYSGGGADNCTLNNCTISANGAFHDGGGGAAFSTLNNCTIRENAAVYVGDGGGAVLSTLNNCTVTGNRARGNGGGVSQSVLNNCTLTGNSTISYINHFHLLGGFGGGAYESTLNNCIVYYNSAERGDNNYSGGVVHYCCTTPMPGGGLGNITAEPQLTDLAHLSTASPCRSAGSAAYTSAVDIDGEAWANSPSIGCDESYADATTGPLSVAIAADYTNAATGFTVNFTAQLEGRASANRWEFGDGTIVSNRPVSVSHSWSAQGDYAVFFRAYNDSNPGGVSATVTVRVMEQQIHYVAAGSGSPVAPYSSWATAATNIQDAVDTVTVVGALVLVSNGVYQTGYLSLPDERDDRRVSVGMPMTLRSVNGPEVTVIDGANAVGCVYLANGAVMMGFTLTNGAGYSGGGIFCESVSAMVFNCMLTGNSAVVGGGAYRGTLNNCTLTANSAPAAGGSGGSTGLILYGGGGANESTLNNCTLADNSAVESGGGAFGGTLNNCTLTGNSAGLGGGAFGGTLNNCIVYFNTATNGANFAQDDPYIALNYCCTTPLPANGGGNFTSAPLFVDQAAGNLRLQTNSPCINSGHNAYAPAGPDLDDHPRIVGGTVDVGAYEFQSPQSAISYSWLQGYGLPIDGSADFTDFDGDRLNNWQEWRCLTDPANALSALRLLPPASKESGVTVRWQSVSGLSYFLERSTHLDAQPAFEALARHLIGQAGITVHTDTNAVGPGPFFYRVGVE